MHGIVPMSAATVTSPAEQTPTLSVRGLRVEFPAFAGPPLAAIPDLDLDIAPGEIVGLAGEAGAGKTVLARSLFRLVPEPGRIAGGAIRFDGEDLIGFDERSLQKLRGRSMTLIAANPRGELNPLRTVGDQISTMARVHLGVDRRVARQMTLDMLRAVQIPDPERRYDAYPHELSGGMAQRIVIAVALICSPRFVVADDATSGLDVTVQAQVLDLLRKLTLERGSSLLFITRDVGIAAHFCDRVAVMYRGEIMEVAPRETFFFQPRHPYTVMLLAAFSHNQRLRAGWSRPSKAAAEAVPGVGCSYASRCPKAAARCLVERPAATNLGGGQVIRCHYPVER